MIVFARREHHGNVSWAWWDFWSHHSAGSSQRNWVSEDEKEEEAVLCLSLVSMLIRALHCWPLKGHWLVLENALQNNGTRTACSSGAGTRVGALSLWCSFPAYSHDTGKFSHSSYTPSFSELIAEENPLPNQGLSVLLLKWVHTTSMCGRDSAPQKWLSLIMLIPQFPADSFRDGRGWGTESDEALKTPH